MNYPTIALYPLIEKVAGLLKNSAEISEFCVTNYGKNPKISIGYNKKLRFDAAYNPAIMVLPGTKNEGLNRDANTYNFTIGWCVTKDVINDIDGISILPGIEQCDQLGQLIINCFCEEFKRRAEVDTIDYEIEPVEMYPQFPGYMDITIRLPSAIGGKLEF
ncbi:MAG: hypothetical protein WCP79_06965 [Bacillota bacterium]